MVFNASDYISLGESRCLEKNRPFMKDVRTARVPALEGHARRVHGRVHEEATLPVSDSATSSARAESHHFI